MSETKKKIVFITALNWETKRLVGFHKFAEFAAKNYETVFFSFPHSYSDIFRNKEHANLKTFFLLKKGKTYTLPNDKKIFNITFPTFRLPFAIAKFLPRKLHLFLLSHGFKSFTKFAKKYFSNANYFIFQSCEGIVFFDTLKKIFPKAKMIYRSADPFVISDWEYLKILEKNIILKSDKTICVNEESVTAYKSAIPDFEKKVSFCIIPNGVDLDAYKKKYDCPLPLQNKKTALYVGAVDIEWNLILEASKKISDANFVIVCPNYPNKKIAKEISKHINIVYIPGVKPNEVPAWISNCTVFIVPYKKNFQKKIPISLTAKHYQAMAAKKKIVSFCDSPAITKYGIRTTFYYHDFISEVREALKNPHIEYEFNLDERNWNRICEHFFKEIETV